MPHRCVRRREQSRNVSCNRDERNLWVVELAPAVDAIPSVASRQLLDAGVRCKDRVDRSERIIGELLVLFHRGEGGGHGGAQLERRRKKARLGCSGRKLSAYALGFADLDGPGSRQKIDDVAGRTKRAALVIERDDGIDEVGAEIIADTRKRFRDVYLLCSDAHARHDSESSGTASNLPALDLSKKYSRAISPIVRSWLGLARMLTASPAPMSPSSMMRK